MNCFLHKGGYMKRLYDVSKETEALLEAHPDTRDSDDVLYFRFIRSIKPDLTIHDVFMNRENFGLPPYESVRRTRQKIQEKRPELRGSKRVQQLRKEREEEYLEFVING